MKKKLHIDSKIFFPNPYVVMLEHNSYEDVEPWHFQKLTRKVYRLIKGTWGYCKPEPEYKFPEKDEKKSPTLPLLSGKFIPIHNMDSIYRSYWVFKDEIDALQFRLMIGEKSDHVYMWPKRYFTIHEVIETDEP